MSHNQHHLPKNRKKFSDWLEFLQQESWQLELIISSILLLILGSSDEYVEELGNTFQTNIIGFIIALFQVVLIFIKTNLVIHIFFRGLWIGCIGLRYVSQDINFDQLSYSERFKKFLRKRVRSFDDYIEKLERISSIIFSYSFLMVFHFIAFCIYIAFGLTITYILREIEAIPKIIDKIWIVLFLLAGLINLIDFVTVGWLKKNKWTSLLFYPIYRFYNLFSLSFVYRPLHYNFIDNRLGRRYMLFMIPYMLFLMVFYQGIHVGSYNYIDIYGTNNNWVVHNFYDELREDVPIQNLSIDKLNYKSGPIQLFIKYKDRKNTEDALEIICPDYKPADRKEYELRFLRQLRLGFESGNNKKMSNISEDSLARANQLRNDESLECISKLYKVSIDSLNQINLDYAFFEHQYDEIGLLTYIDISDLKNGKHTLHVNMIIDYEDDAFKTKSYDIIFFKHQNNN